MSTEAAEAYGRAKGALAQARQQMARFSREAVANTEYDYCSNAARYTPEERRAQLEHVAGLREGLMRWAPELEKREQDLAEAHGRYVQALASGGYQLDYDDEDEDENEDNGANVLRSHEDENNGANLWRGYQYEDEDEDEDYGALPFLQ